MKSGITSLPQEGQTLKPLDGILTGSFALKLCINTLPSDYMYLTDVPPSSTSVSSKDIIPRSLITYPVESRGNHLINSEELRLLTGEERYASKFPLRSFFHHSSVSLTIAP